MKKILIGLVLVLMFGLSSVAEASTLSQFTTAIKSIQRGTIEITAGEGASDTATITAVVTAKTLLNYLGSSCDNDSHVNADCKIVLTNSTTVTASRSGNAGAVTVSYEVIEFY